MKDQAGLSQIITPQELRSRTRLGYAGVMTARSKLLRRIVEGNADADIAFNDLRNLLRSLGFRETIRGSHHVFRRRDVPEKINLQDDGGNAKVYQVRQVRRILVNNRLTGAK